MDIGRRGVGMQHQVRRTGVAGLGKMDHITGPRGAALGAEAGLGIVGGFDPVAGTATLYRPQTNFWRHARARLIVRAFEVPGPNAPE